MPIIVLVCPSAESGWAGLSRIRTFLCKDQIGRERFRGAEHSFLLSAPVLLRLRSLSTSPYQTGMRGGEINTEA